MVRPTASFLLPALVIILASVSASNSQLTCSNKTLSIDRLADNNAGDALRPYYEIAVSFINAVHLDKPLNTDHIRLVVDYFTNNTAATLTFKDVFAATKPLIVDQIAFICLLVIGLLFVILFPLVGLFFCCCRLCGNCGGKKYQKSSSSCSCATMSIVLVICILVFAAATTLYALNNRRLYRELDTAPVEFANQTEYVAEFVADVSHTLACSIQDSSDRGYSLLVSATASVGTAVEDTVMKASGMQALRDIQAISGKLSQQLGTLNDEMPKLCNDSGDLSAPIQKFLSDFLNSSVARGYQKKTNASKIEQELKYNCPSHSPIQSPVLGAEFTKEMQSNVAALQKKTNELQSKINDSLNAGPSDSIKDALSQIRQFSDKVITAISDVQKALNPRVDEMAKVLSPSWYEYLGLILIAPIVLIACCLLIGLVCGSCAYSSDKPPFKRSCASDCGGCCLMSASGLVFIFGWLIMAVTMVAFSVGYLSETAVCQPIFKNPSHDVLKLFPNITLDAASGTVLSAEQVVQGCKSNQPIYEVMKLESIVKMNQTLQNINNSWSVVMEELDLQSHLDVGDITNQITGSIIGNLTTFADILNRAIEPALRGVTDNLTEPTSTVAELNNVVNFLKSQTSAAAINFRRNASLLLSELIDFDNLVKNVSQSATNARLLSAQIRFLISYDVPGGNSTALVTDAIMNEALQLQKSVQDVLNNEIASINHAVHMSGSCRPLYDIYDNVGVLLCQRVLYPLQGFWLSLGCCAIFFLPAVICGIKLAKYFRRMDEHFYSNAAMQEQARWSTAMEMPVHVRNAW